MNEAEERKAFEEWADKSGFHLTRRGAVYKDEYADIAWDVWLGRAALSAPPREPLTKGEIYTAYIAATNQTLRAVDEKLALAFARAIEQAHGIGEK